MTDFWIGVDLDGTLAHYDEWEGPEHVGAPIPVMMERVRNWVAKGITVKIFTARCHEPSQIPPVRRWLEAHGLGDLEITNVKDFNMAFLYDDRCVTVEKNTGKLLSPEPVING